MQWESRRLKVKMCQKEKTEFCMMCNKEIKFVSSETHVGRWICTNCGFTTSEFKNE